MSNQGGKSGQSPKQKQAQKQAQRAASAAFSGTKAVPEARDALNNMKHEIASELGITLKQGYNGDLSSRQAGFIGGYMVKRLVQQAMGGK